MSTKVGHSGGAESFAALPGTSEPRQAVKEATSGDELKADDVQPVGQVGKHVDTHA